MTDHTSTDPTAAHDMIDAFTSAGVTTFDITLKNEAGAKVGYLPHVAPAVLRSSIDWRLTSAEQQRVNFIIRPRPDRGLVQLDDLNKDILAKLLPFAFLAFETSPGNSQVWLAVNGEHSGDFDRRLKKGTGADGSASRATRIAGSLNFKEKYAPDYPRVMITYRALGRVTTPAALEEAGLVAAHDTFPCSVSHVSTSRHTSKWPDYARNLAAAPVIDTGNPTAATRILFGV